MRFEEGGVKNDELAPGEGLLERPNRSLWLALVGFSLFSLGDVITKSTHGFWPGAAVAALRFTLGACGLALLAWRLEGRGAFAMPQRRWQMVRGIAIAFSTLCYFTAVQLMPLATATAIGFTAPPLTALLSALFLREDVSPRIWGVIALAFAGTLLVLRPSLAMLGWTALLPVGSALGMAVLMIANRAVAGSTSPLAAQFLAAAICAPILWLAALLLDWSGAPALHIGALSSHLFLEIALLAVIATGGHMLIYLATTRSSAARIAPTNYVQILFAVALGWIIFGDRPDLPSLAGMVMIIGAGLWLFQPGRVRR